jgi:hypothetical protein
MDNPFPPLLCFGCFLNLSFLTPWFTGGYPIIADWLPPPFEGLTGGPPITKTGLLALLILLISSL